MAQIPYLYRKLLNLGVPADIATQVADTDYDGEVTTSLSDLADVDVADVDDAAVLTWDETSGKWIGA